MIRQAIPGGINLPTLYPRQRRAIYDPARYSIIEASTKAGKTFGCISWMLEHAWQSKPYRNYWWVAPVSSQANIAFDRVRNYLRVQHGGIVVGKAEKSITMPSGGKIWFKSGDRPDSLFGDDVYAAVIDEATRLKEDAYTAVRSTLTATRGPIRIIGNVKGRRNWAYRMARRAQKGAANMAYHKLTAYHAAAGGIFPISEILDAKANLPDHIFRELYLAEPSDDGGNPFGLLAIERCVAPISLAQPVAWGWDLAKKQDWTVGIGLDFAGRVCRFKRFQKPWRETIEIIRAETGETDALVDSTGVGDPIVEELQSNAPNYEGFQFTSISKQQLMEGLAMTVHRGEIEFPEGPIRLEMDAFEYVHTKTGVRYSAPEGEHDDCVCALGLAVAKWRQSRGVIIAPAVRAPQRRVGVMG